VHPIPVSSLHYWALQEISGHYWLSLDIVAAFVFHGASRAILTLKWRYLTGVQIMVLLNYVIVTSHSGVIKKKVYRMWQ